MRKEPVVHGAQVVLWDPALVAQGALRDVEVWTYDFGPQMFVRFAIICDGVVFRVDDGNRGYAR